MSYYEDYITVWIERDGSKMPYEFNRALSEDLCDLMQIVCIEARKAEGTVTITIVPDNNEEE